jgi:hypothetical protein
MGIVDQPVQVRNHDGQGVDTKADRSCAPTFRSPASRLSRSRLSKRGSATTRVDAVGQALDNPQYEPSFVRERRLDLAPIAPA